LLRSLPKRGLSLGLVTGILPCGLLASAWALAAAAGDPAGGAASMAIFALGSLPGLIAPVLAGRFATRLGTSPFLHGALWCGLGLWIAARPLVAGLLHHGCH
jgi:sulfite exporter TauE/SafE